MMILTFLKLAVAQFDNLTSVATKSDSRDQAETTPYNHFDDDYDNEYAAEPDDFLNRSSRSLEGRTSEQPSDELARFSLTTPGANSSGKHDHDRWM